ncbi:MAG: homoserine O-acetyltransferase/O-succinyltransferase family protein [Acidimicrobiales bacterium]
MTAVIPIERRTGSPVARRSLEVALVNLMPDTAFQESERQFTDLVLTGSGELPVHLERYTISARPRPAELQAVVEKRYHDLEELCEGVPDAVVVTGTEPKAGRLLDEDIWEDLSRLYRWAEASGTALYSSCLSSHVSLLALDGLERRRLPAKLSGVFAQEVRPDPLTEGVGPLRCPHSRLHEIPTDALAAAGYRVLVGSSAVGWTVAARDAGCLSVLVQGHPEYGPTTLLREYRRDVRRFVTGDQDDYPPMPVGYLRDDAVALLELFRLAATTGARDPSLIDLFPFHFCADRIGTDWGGPLERLVGNWLHEVARRVNLGALAPR